MWPRAGPARATRHHGHHGAAASALWETHETEIPIGNPRVERIPMPGATPTPTPQPPAASHNRSIALAFCAAACRCVAFIVSAQYCYNWYVDLLVAYRRNVRRAEWKAE